MAVITQIDIEISGFDRYEYVVAKQGDEGSRYIQIRFLNNGKVFILDNMTKARAIITKADSKEVFKDCVKSGNYVELELDKNILATAGTAHIEIILSNIGTGDVMTSADLDLKVIASKDTSNIESSDDYLSLRSALLKLDNTATAKEVLIMRSRINNLIALSEDDIWLYNAELADIRIDVDGQEYECAGQAVREQINLLRFNLNEINEKVNQDAIDINNYIQKNLVKNEMLQKILIKQTAQGSNLSINDSADFPIQDLSIYGQSFQYEMPTFENPDEIISTAISDIFISGNQENQNVKFKNFIKLCGLPTNSKSIPGNVTIDGVDYISDVIEEKDGVIGVTRNIAKIVLRGNEAWSKRAIVTKADNYQCKFAELNFNNDASIKNPSLCNYFQYDNNIDLNGYETMGHGYITVSFAEAGTSTADDLNAFAAEKYNEGNPITFYCPTATPTFEPLPEDVQQAIRELKTYYPKTFIQSNAEVKVTYIADTKNYIDGKLNELASNQIQAMANVLSLMPDETKAAIIENETNKLIQESEEL